MPSDVLVVTPWYPTADRPFYGGFVKDWVLALQQVGVRVEVVHLDNVPDAAEMVVTDTTTVGGAPLTHAVVPQPAGATRADMARVQAAALRTLWPQRWADVEVVHGHVTMPTGWALATVIPPDVRLVLTEHATYLNQLFRLPETAQMYADAVARSSACLAVSEKVAATLRTAAPSVADRFAALGNPVAFHRLPLLGDRQPDLLRWLYLGNFIERKGLLRLLDAFAAANETERAGGRLTLTLVGDGPMRDQLAARAAELGVADRVTIRPSVPPEQVGEIYADHDLLVHLSTYETFGMTVVEAVASGLPTIVTRCGGPEETVLSAADMGAVAYVPVTEDTSSVVDGWNRLSRRHKSVDWPAVRVILEHRFAPAEVGALVAARLGIATAVEHRVPLRLRIVTVDEGSEHQAATLLDVVRDLGLEISTATVGPGNAFAAQVARLRIGRQPRRLTARARAAILAEPADLVAVDSYVGASLVGRGDGLPPLIPLTDRSRLWRAIGTAIAAGNPAGRAVEVGS